MQQSLTEQADALESSAGPRIKPGVTAAKPARLLDQADNVEYTSRLNRVNERFAKQYGRPIDVTGLDTPMHRKGNRQNFTSDVRTSDLSPEHRKYLQQIGDEEGIKFDDYTDTWKQKGFTGPHMHGQMVENYKATSWPSSPRISMSQPASVSGQSFNSPRITVETPQAAQSYSAGRIKAPSVTPKRITSQPVDETAQRLVAEFERLKAEGNISEANRRGLQLQERGFEFGSERDVEGKEWPYVKPGQAGARRLGPLESSHPSTGSTAFVNNLQAEKEQKRQREEFRRNDQRGIVRRFTESASRGARETLDTMAAGAGRLIEGVSSLPRGIKYGVANLTTSQEEQDRRAAQIEPAIGPADRGVGGRLEDFYRQRAEEAQEAQTLRGQDTASQVGHGIGQTAPYLIPGGGSTAFAVESALGSYGEGSSLDKAILTGVMSVAGLKGGHELGATLAARARNPFTRFAANTAGTAAGLASVRAGTGGGVADTPEAVAHEIAMAIGFSLIGKGWKAKPEARERLNQVAREPEVHPEVKAEIEKIAATVEPQVDTARPLAMTTGKPVRMTEQADAIESKAPPVEVTHYSQLQPRTVEGKFDGPPIKEAHAAERPVDASPEFKEMAATAIHNNEAYEAAQARQQANANAEMEAARKAISDAKTKGEAINNDWVLERFSVTDAEASSLVEESIAKPRALPKNVEAAREASESVTGIRNATTASEREAQGKSEVEVEGRRTFGDVWDSAKQKIDSREVDPGVLARSVAERPRPLSAEESAVLIHDRMRLQQTRKSVMGEVEKAIDAKDGNAEIEARARLKVIEENLDINDHAARKAGYEQGLGLSIRRAMIKEDYSLARLIQRAKVKSGGEVSEATRAKLEEISQRLEKAELALSDKDARIAELEANRKIDRTIKEERRRVRRTETKEALTQEFGALKADFSKWAQKSLNQTNAMFDPEGVAIIAKMAKNRVRAGVNSVEGLVDEIHTVLKDHIEDLSKRDVRDALSGYGKTAEMSKDDINVRLRELKRQARVISSIEDAQSGRRPAKSGLQREPESRRVKELKARLDEVLKQQGIKREMSPEQRAESVRKRLEADITDLDRRISEGDFSSRKQSRSVGTPEIDRLRARRVELKKQYDALKPEGAQPIRDPMPAIKTRLQNQISDLEQQIASGSFAKPQPRAPLVYDREAEGFRARRDALRAEADREIRKLEKQNRSTGEKVADFVVSFRRAVLLSSMKTLGKLSMAATGRTAITPIEEAIGSGLSRVPGIRGIAARAPREGGLNPRAERAAFSNQFSRETLADMKQVAKTGASSLDVRYGGKDAAGEPEMIELFGRLHGALKAPVKRAEFFRSLEKRATFERQQAIKKGMSAEEADTYLQRPDVQAQLAAKAYVDANRAIFMSDNGMVSAYRAMTRYFNSMGEPGDLKRTMGKGAAKTAQFFLPIVKVPTNYVAETSSYGIGGIKSLGQLISAKGIKNLTPDQADYIMRNLKKQTIGAAVMALGYFGASQVGGYYQRGDEKDKDKPDAGTFRVFGWTVPRWATHTPLLEALQIGATIRRVEDKAKQGEGKVSAIAAGVAAAGKGLGEEIPFFNEPVRIAEALHDWKGLHRFTGETTRSFLVPPDVQNIARMTDKDEKGETVKRKPEGFIDEIKMGIPSLRGSVPLNERVATEALKNEIVSTAKTGDLKTAREKADKAIASGDISVNEAEALGDRISLSENQLKIKHAPLKRALEFYNALPKAQQDELAPMIIEKFENTSPDSVRGKDKESLNKQYDGLAKRYPQLFQ